MFTGIPAEMQSFMTELRNRNSKPWYDSHKKEYQRLVKEPFGELTMELGEVARKIDDRILIEPRRCVSRARRDTRFTHDKSLYRNNVWISFKPALDRWDIPAFFFEVLPDSFQYGLAFLDMSPAYLRKFRDYISDCPGDFKKAVQEAQSGGLTVSGECYKKPKEGAPKGLEEWFTYKNFYLVAKRYDCEILQTRDFIPDVIKAFEGAAHFYEIFMEVADSKPGEFSYESYTF
ncbi:MAG: DUF2461 domain-containing protein [Clostridia bacterium]|nr:DUF2461 domain-containing protein [Clostridia bacterium]